MMSDLISRQQAIDALDCNFTITGKDNAETVYQVLKGFSDRIKALPSVQPEYTEKDMREQFNAGYACGMEAAQPERNIGEWILPNNPIAKANDEWICSACHCLIAGKHNYCPYCGARMLEEGEEG